MMFHRVLFFRSSTRISEHTHKKTELKKSGIEWTSEDESIATVNSNGKVTGVSAGTVTIYTNAGGVRNECK